MRATVPIDFGRSVKELMATVKYDGMERMHIEDRLSNGDAHTVLSSLAKLALDPKFTVPIMASFEPLFLELVARWMSSDYDELVVLGALGRVCYLSHSSHSLIEHFLTTKEEYRKAFHISTDVASTKELLLAFYRLIYADSSRFSQYLPVDKLYLLLESSDDAIKFLAIQLLGCILNKSTSTKTSWVNRHTDPEKAALGEYECDSDIDFKYLEMLEAKRLALGGTLLTQSDRAEAEHRFDFECNGLLINIGGVLVPRLNQGVHRESSFVSTSSAEKSIQSLARGLLSTMPLLLLGSAGAGKTFYVEELAKSLHRFDDMVRIHLGDQTDAKILIGTYTTGQQPGTFEWSPGILTSAVKNGKWVLIEDIDKAPTEVLSVLLPLMEKRELLIPSRGETIKAAQGFQIFGTITTSAKKGGLQSNQIGMRLWKQIEISTPSTEDLSTIVAKRFNLLERLASTFVTCFTTVVEEVASPRFISLCKNQTRQISSRDLFKWAHRANNFLHEAGITSGSQEFPDEVFHEIFIQAIDCFASFVPTLTGREYLASIIGEKLNIPHSLVHVLQKVVPHYTDSRSSFEVGRVKLSKSSTSLTRERVFAAKNARFALTNHSLRLIKQVCKAVAMTEPLLLVGETGTGKTTVVQYVANQVRKNLTVINVSQQTESSDLLGGYKPVDAAMIASPMKDEFEHLFELTFKKNTDEYLMKMNDIFHKKRWPRLVKAWRDAAKLAKDGLSANNGEDGPKKKRKLDSSKVGNLLTSWQNFEDRLDGFEHQVKQADSAFFFSFVEGALVQAVRRGDWVLLDEINLASPDTLESIADLLVESPSITLSEKGDAEAVKAHPEFRLFACMNPATDIGKRDLPVGLRSRFTELYVPSPDQDRHDLIEIIKKYIGTLVMSDRTVCDDVAELYLQAKKLAEENRIVDGANQRPHFSVRTLSRTLTYTESIAKLYGVRRSLYEGFCMSFLTLLDQPSEALLEPLISKYTVEKLPNAKAVLKYIPNKPVEDEHIQFRHYWLRRGPLTPDLQENYILTPSVEKNLLNLVRATASRRFPVLIQGPTSSGKTSMINYLARATGHKFVRINNHEHTDLQEYVGTYVSDERGQLKFQDGVLVEALRNGHWIVLDELNLAPTDVLEALNRLLDDNRELFIPETQEVVKPHPEFMLFATQNPPGLYGGRKVLSRAFRNRFLELHYDDIPQDELETILTKRCLIAPSYARKIVEVYHTLSLQRQSTRVFEQKNSFATLRDLFRWANREAVGYEQLALNGYMLLGERVRKKEERAVVRDVIQSVMRVNLDFVSEYKSLEQSSVIESTNEVVWTKGMRRLLVLVSEALNNNEPILLVGETGCGKTTICQILAEALKKRLLIVNAHQNTETGDIIGAQRPVRSRSEDQRKLTLALKNQLSLCGVSTEKLDNHDLDDLLAIYDEADKGAVSSEELLEIQRLRDRLKVLFEWNDGSLIQAMKSGDFFLLDEISLADDSVLERLNSVLEPERLLLLSEKGSLDAVVSAHEGFQFFATMNPGGDYGKKELSPALRNRFTEIWVPSMEDFDDVLEITQARLSDGVRQYAKAIVQFSKWYGMEYGAGDVASGVISLRDILAWVNFANKLEATIDPVSSVFHGACMVFIDSVGTNFSASFSQNSMLLKKERFKCVEKLSSLLNKNFKEEYSRQYPIEVDEVCMSAGPFRVKRSRSEDAGALFNLQAPTTAMNVLRVLRGMEAHKPILLEGSPGVGKTSLVSAIANVTGHSLTRINLSEQTDLIDLFGADAPAEGKAAGEFVWRDAPFLRAMRRGEWVLLDEMNLASQSVLEGLNACLDHRGEVYIPELDRTFTCHPSFTVFAAQNPQHQGGGRKGLPKSFINRFTVVYVDSLELEDLKLISKYLHPNLSTDTIDRMVNFVLDIDFQVSVQRNFGHVGSPFEFNLRDSMRWLGLMSEQHSLHAGCEPSDFFDLIIGSRFRTESDYADAKRLFEKHFGVISERERYFNIGDDYFQSGHASVSRLSDYATSSRLQPLQCHAGVLETALTCIAHSWPLILTGPTNSGKTSLVRLLADSVGAQLTEFAMNGDIDSTDLLGGFDQVDIANDASHLWSRAGKLMESLISDALTNGNSQAKASPSALLQYIKNFPSPGRQELLQMTTLLKEYESYSSAFEPAVQSLIEACTKTLAEMEKVQTVKFQWFDGILIKAVEEGHWLVLDNANLCNPSVLDRLNSLLEPNGCLMVNECALEDGEPRVVTPHKDFRLFLTVDTKYGELSRAMRNRGVEVFMRGLDECATPFDRSLMGMETVRSPHASIGDLKIDVQTLPMSRFVSPSHSAAGILARVDDVACISSSGVLDHVAHSSLSLLSISAASILNGWLNVMQRSSLFGYMSRDMVAAIQLGVRGLQGTYEAQLKALYAKAQEAFMLPLQEQHYSVFVNGYFARLGPSNGYPLSLLDMWMGMRLVLSTEVLTSSLKKVVVAAEVKLASQLSYLSLSAAVYYGKPIKSPPRVAVFALLKAVSDYASLFCNMLEQLSSDDLIALQELQQLASDLFTLTDAAEVDESQLHTYREFLDDWQEGSCSKAPVLVAETAATSSLRDTISSFGNQLKLKTGGSMSLIWSSTKGDYPKTEQGWIRYNRMLSACDTFDATSLNLHANFKNDVAKLRKTIFEIVSDAASFDNQETEVAITLLEQQVEKLMDQQTGTESPRKLLYADAFSTIKAYVEVCSMNSKSAEAYNALVHLTYHSGGSTTNLIGAMEQRRPYEPVLKNIWWGAMNSDNAIGSTVSATLDNSLISQLMKSLEDHESRPAVISAQSAHELQDLGSAVIVNAGYIIGNPMEELKIQLDKQVSDVLKLHSGLENESFLDLKKSIIEPVLSELHHSGADAQALGNCWIRFSAALILLFFPNIPFDPAIRQHVEWRRMMNRKTSLENEMQSWNLMQEVFYGVGADSTQRALSQLLQNLDYAPMPTTYRPAINEMGSLHREIMATVDSNVSPKAIDRLLTSGSLEQIAVWQRNTDQFLARIKKKFQGYSDIIDIFEGYVYGLKLGFELLTYSRVSKSDAGALRLLDPLVSSSGIALKEFVGQYSTAAGNGPLNVNPRILIQSLNMLALHSFVAREPVSENVLNPLLSDFHLKWRLRREKEEQDEAIKNAVFIDDTEEAVEEEFGRMFPDYEGEVNELVEKSQEEEALNYALAKAYLNIYCPEELNICELLSEVASDLRHLPQDGAASTVKYAAPYRVLTTILNSFSGAIGVSDEQKDFNFYHDPSVQETDRVIKLVTQVKSTIRPLISQWPEHQVLQELNDACDELLLFPVKTAVAKFLQKLDQIYVLLTRWEENASKETSVSQVITLVTTLIVDWRRLELSTWAKLFEFEKRADEKELGKWWYHLYESIFLRLTDGMELAVEPLTQALSIFMSNSSLGQYRLRLLLLRAFSKHVDAISVNNAQAVPVSKAIQNVVQFYDQYSSDVDERLKAGASKLQQQIHEKIKLVTFKDTNPVTLKQYTRKSHSDLHKIVRKYRALIKEKVTGIVSAAPSIVAKSAASFQVDLTGAHALSESHSMVLEKTQLFGDRPQVLKSEVTLKKMSAVVDMVHQADLPNLESYVKELKSEVMRLKEETPQTLTEDNKKIVSQLRNEKLNLFTNTLKDLQSAGIMREVKASVRKRVTSVVNILSTTSNLNDRPVGLGDVDFFRIVETLPRLRAAVESSEHDVPQAYLQRGINMIMNLLDQLLKVRENAYTFFKDYDRLQKLKECALKISSLSDVFPIRFDVSSAIDVLRWVPQMIAYTLQSCATTQSLLGANVPTGIFVNFERRMADMLREIETYEYLYHFGASCQELEDCQSMISVEFISFKKELEKWLASSPECLLIAKTLHDWIDSVLPKLENAVQKTEAVDAVEHEQLLRKLGGSMLVSFQKIQKIFAKEQDPENESQDESKWFATSLSTVRLGSRGLCQEEVSRVMEQAVRMTVASSDTNSIPLLCSTLPYFVEYVKLCGVAGRRLLENYSSLAKALSILCALLLRVATEGLCTPQEPQDKPQESSKTEDGTGLGDGQGEQASSKDLDEDDDLEDIAQQENKEQEKNDQEDDGEDNAVELEGDMAGELEDAPDQEDDEEQNEKDENDEPDDEIGDIDDLDPNAIDEKMWNDDSPPEEDEKEKKSDAVPESNNDDLEGNNEDGDEDTNENDQGQQTEEAKNEDDAEEEDDAAEQEDTVNEEGQRDQLDDQAEDADMMDLPEDMNLDDGNKEEDSAEDSGNESFDDDGLDDGLEDDEEPMETAENQQSDNEAEGDDLDAAEVDEKHDPDANESDNEERMDEDGNEEDSNAEPKPEDTPEPIANDESSAQPDQLTDADGLHGPDDADDDAAVEMSTSGGQTSDKPSEGADTAMGELRDQNSQGANRMTKEEKDPSFEEATEAEEKAEQETRDSMRQLGDALEQFHKRRQEIKASNTADEQVDQDVNEKPDEFEHLDDADVMDHSQALGAARQDELQNIDDSLAIEEDQEDDNVNDEATVHEQNEPEPESMVDADDQGNNEPDRDQSGVGNMQSERSDKDDMVVDQEDVIDELDEDMDLETAQELEIDGQIVTPARSPEEARELWRKYDASTQDLALILCEQLRLILEPTMATKLRGDFKTGKRLNMKRIIPYIASQFKKDKIWMRRTKPSKRQYQIMISIDDSKSMAESQAVDLAFQTIALVSKALTQLEAGQLAISRFGDFTQLIHPFQKPFSSESGVEMLQWFGFDQVRTNVKKLLQSSLKLFEEAKQDARQDIWQLQIIISDGICEDHENLRRLVREAQDQRIMIVFVVVDNLNQQSSILDLTDVRYIEDASGQRKMVMERYLDHFAFDYYVIVKDIRELPGVLSMVLRQYFSEAAE